MNLFNVFKFYKYYKFYTQPKFIKFFNAIGRKLFFAQKALVIYFCLRDKDTPKFVQYALMGALGYLILPFDIIPDFLTGFGWFDDAAVLGMALKMAGNYAKPEHWSKASKIVPFGK